LCFFCFRVYIQPRLVFPFFILLPLSFLRSQTVSFLCFVCTKCRWVRVWLWWRLWSGSVGRRESRSGGSFFSVIQSLTHSRRERKREAEMHPCVRVCLCVCLWLELRVLALKRRLGRPSTVVFHPVPPPPGSRRACTTAALLVCVTPPSLPFHPFPSLLPPPQVCLGFSRFCSLKVINAIFLVCVCVLCWCPFSLSLARSGFFFPGYHGRLLFPSSSQMVIVQVLPLAMTSTTAAVTRSSLFVVCRSGTHTDLHTLRGAAPP
jgi:hypothetical protein